MHLYLYICPIYYYASQENATPDFFLGFLYIILAIFLENSIKMNIKQFKNGSVLVAIFIVIIYHNIIVNKTVFKK